MVAIIPAGGKGKRLYPLTLSTPKALLKVADKPLIEYPLLYLHKNGINNIAVTVNEKDRALIKYLREKSHVKYVVDKEEKGPFSGIDTSLTDEEDSFLIIFSDIITSFDLKGLIRHHKKSGAFVTSGIADNKPAGIFAVKKDAFFSPDFSIKENINYYDDECALYDIDTPSDFRRISKDILFKEELSFYLKDPSYIKTRKVIIDTSSHLEIGATINPPVFIGKNAYIEAGAEIGAFSVIGEGCKISRNSKTENSVIMANSLILKDTVLKNTVISENTIIKKGAKILDNTVIGKGCVIGEGSVVSPNVNIWPNKKTEDYKVVEENIIDTPTDNKISSGTGEINVRFLNMAESFLLYDENGALLTHEEINKIKNRLFNETGRNPDSFLFITRLIGYLKENNMLLKDFKIGL